MALFQNKILLKKIFLVVIFLCWVFFALRLSFDNIRLLITNYVLFHDKTTAGKLSILLTNDYSTFAFISKNTKSNATVLLLSDLKNVFFDYYLYPRKILWLNTPAQDVSEEYIHTQHIDMVISYDENNNILARTIQP